MLGPGSPTRPTASTFNTMMSMFMRQGRCDQVRRLLKQQSTSCGSPLARRRLA